MVIGKRQQKGVQDPYAFEVLDQDFTVQKVIRCNEKIPIMVIIISEHKKLPGNGSKPREPVVWPGLAHKINDLFENNSLHDNDHENNKNMSRPQNRRKSYDHWNAPQRANQKVLPRPWCYGHRRGNRLSLF